MSNKPDVATLKAVVRDILEAIGAEQMSQSWDAIDDLLWDYHPPYQHLLAAEREAWQAAFRAELEGGYEG